MRHQATSPSFLRGVAHVHLFGLLEIHGVGDVRAHETERCGGKSHCGPNPCPHQ